MENLDYYAARQKLLEGKKISARSWQNPDKYLFLDLDADNTPDTYFPTYPAHMRGMLEEESKINKSITMHEAGLFTPGYAITQADAINRDFFVVE